jgi:hypothetical protein
MQLAIRWEVPVLGIGDSSGWCTKGHQVFTPLISRVTLA